MPWCSVSATTEVENDDEFGGLCEDHEHYWFNGMYWEDFAGVEYKSNGDRLNAIGEEEE